MNAIVERALECLPLPDPALLDAAREDAATKARHDSLAAEIAALDAVEYRPPLADHRLEDTLRLAAWNAERLKFGADSAALFSALAPDIVLLTEVDIGMARSGNRHTAAELAVASGFPRERMTIHLIGPSIGPHVGPGAYGGVVLRPARPAEA